MHVDSLGMFVASISGTSPWPPRDGGETTPILTGNWEAWLDSFVAREASYVHTLYTAARKAYFTAEQELPTHWDAGDPYVGDFDRHAQLDYEPEFYLKCMAGANPEDAIIDMVYEHERFDRDVAQLHVRVSNPTEEHQLGSPDDFLEGIRRLREIILSHRPFVPPDEPPKEYTRFDWPKYRDTTAARPIPEPIDMPALHKYAENHANRRRTGRNVPVSAMTSADAARRDCTRKVRFDDVAIEPPTPCTLEEKGITRAGQQAQNSWIMNHVFETVISLCCNL
ncbi:hypothetical protein AURDEDRAFT_116169 [Auricularia subglabra TFB-10046 SS5]|nr:hypothetical protein AURDEDRAFT_116169 [Auricularia subglabra TFB-10046 SS5]